MQNQNLLSSSRQKVVTYKINDANKNECITKLKKKTNIPSLMISYNISVSYDFYSYNQTWVLLSDYFI